jgi:phosphoglycolate phosphatase-like HAD superfamily hydrolase
MEINSLNQRSILVKEDLLGGIIQARDRKDAKSHLKRAFDETAYSVLISKAGRVWSSPLAVGFDMDGVITKEIGYFSRTWATLFRRALKDPNARIGDISPSDLAFGKSFRRETKGGVLMQRVKLFTERVKVDDKETNPVKLQDTYITLLRQQITSQFEGNFGEYLLEGADAVLAELQSKGIPAHLITANIQPQAEWMADKLGIRGRFKTINGYPMSVVDGKEPTKTSIILRILEASDIEPASFLFIGDGTSDIRFGQDAGVATLGVANNFENGCRLIDAGTDFIATNTKTLAALNGILFVTARPPFPRRGREL